MVEIISATDRKGSRTLEISKIIKSICVQTDLEAGLLDLCELPINEFHQANYVPGPGVQPFVKRVNESRGIIMVIPEYNGSFPGVVKYFIDYWKFPDSFEGRPVAFVGLGGRFGGLRPVEHLQQVFSYRNAYLFPQRVFIMNVQNVLKGGEITDGLVMDLLKTQVKDFKKFILGLESQQLDACSLNRARLKN